MAATIEINRCWGGELNSMPSEESGIQRIVQAATAIVKTVRAGSLPKHEAVFAVRAHQGKFETEYMNSVSFYSNSGQ